MRLQFNLPMTGFEPRTSGFRNWPQCQLYINHSHFQLFLFVGHHHSLVFRPFKTFDRKELKLSQDGLNQMSFPSDPVVASFKCRYSQCRWSNSHLSKWAMGCRLFKCHLPFCRWIKWCRTLTVVDGDGVRIIETVLSIPSPSSLYEQIDTIRFDTIRSWQM